MRRIAAAAASLLVASAVVAPIAAVVSWGWWGPFLYVLAGGLTAAVVYGWLVDR